MKNQNKAPLLKVGLSSSKSQKKNWYYSFGAIEICGKGRDRTRSATHGEGDH